MHAGLVGKGAIEKLARLPAEVVISSEFRYQDPILTENDLVVLISQSGETADSLAALRLSKSRGALTLGVVNAVGSSIAREADAVLYTWAGPEIAVASTKAFTVQLIAMYLLALSIALARGTVGPEAAREIVSDMLNLVPAAVQKVIDRKEQIQALADDYRHAENLFFIGRGLDWALSQEGLTQAQGDLLHPLGGLRRGRTQARRDLADHQGHAGDRAGHRRGAVPQSSCPASRRSRPGARG